MTAPTSTSPISTSTSNSCVTEGSAKIIFKDGVFYNPIQEFNRDISIAVIKAFKEFYYQNSNNSKTSSFAIFEGLSATGLRSIRYAKEIPGVTRIMANDFDARAAKSISENIAFNQLDHIVSASHADAK